MEINVLFNVILATVFIFAGSNLALAEKKKMVVLPKPFFSSNFQESKELLRNELVLGNKLVSGEKKKMVGCKESWTFWSNSCYKLLNTSLTWDDALTECKNYNAHLVVIGSKEEEKFISEEFNTLWNGHVWIGLKREESTDTWQWQDSTTYFPTNFETSLEGSSCKSDSCDKGGKSNNGDKGGKNDNFDSGGKSVSGDKGDKDDNGSKDCARIAINGTKWDCQKCDHTEAFICEVEIVF